MKLHTFDVLAAIGESAAKTHDDTTCAAGFGRFIGPGGNLPLCSIGLGTARDGLGKYYERVVTCGDKWVGQTGEDAATIVMDWAGLSVNLDHMARHGHAVTGGETLVTEADAQDGYATGETSDDVAGVAGFIRRAGPGRNDDVSRAFAVVKGFDLVRRDLIVTNHENVAVEVD